MLIITTEEKLSIQMNFILFNTWGTQNDKTYISCIIEYNMVMTFSLIQWFCTLGYDEKCQYQSLWKSLKYNSN